MTHSQIASKINTLLKAVKKGGPSEYFTVEGLNDENIKIRVSNHSGKKQNNNGTKTLSFVSMACNQGYQAITNEWVILKNGLTDTYQSIEEILEWNDVKEN